MDNIDSKTFQLGKDVIRLSNQLRGKTHFQLASQLIRSGTSVGANVREARAGFSYSDFTYKMSIASKEARETLYWLELLESTQTLDEIDLKPVRLNCEEVVRILTTTVKTAQQKIKSSKQSQSKS